MLRKILIITAFFEGITGYLLLVNPILISSMLLGQALSDALAVTILRITGAAILSLASICWLSRDKDNAVNVVKGMLLYNLGVAAILLYGKLFDNIDGLGLLPVIVLHLLLAAWIIFTVWIRPLHST